MNDRQENFFSMVLATRLVLEANKSDWQPIAGFVSAVDDLDEKIEDTEASRLAQEEDRTGIATNKNEVEANLIKTTLNISGAIQAYAADQGDVELKERVSFTKGELQKQRDTILRDISIIVLKEAQKIGAPLNDYGVTAAEVSDFETLTEDYRDIMSRPRVGTTDRKTATEDLVKHLDEIRVIYKERIDKLMLNFEDTHTHFFEKYFNARKIADV